MSIYDNTPSIPGGVGGATIENVNVYPICEVELRHMNVNYDGTASFQVWIKYNERWKLWFGETAPSDIAFFSMSFKDITIVKIQDDMQHHSQFIYQGDTSHEAWGVLAKYFERRTVIKTNPNSTMNVSSSYFFSTAADTWERLCTVYFHADNDDNSVTAANLENVVINSVHATRLVHSDFDEAYGSSNIYPNYDANVHEQVDQDTYSIPTDESITGNIGDPTTVTTPQGNTGKRVQSITFQAQHTVSKVRPYIQRISLQGYSIYVSSGGTAETVWANAPEFEYNAAGAHYETEQTTIKDDYSTWTGTTGAMNFYLTGGYRIGMSAYNPQTGLWLSYPVGHFSITDGDNSYDYDPPTIQILNGVTQSITKGDTWTESANGGFIATDAVDGNLNDETQIGGFVNTNQLGSYTLTYNVQDANGNQATEKTRTVTVVANTAPVITLNGESTITLNIGDDLVDPGATATDAEDNNVVLTNSITYTDIPSTFSTSSPGTLQRTYNVQDSHGAYATPVTRKFVVTAADQAPTLTLANNTDIVYVPINTDWTTSDATAETTYGGFTATDAEDSALSVTLSVPSNWNSGSVPGEYQFEYSVTDSAGNEATATRIVIVLAPPTIDVPSQFLGDAYSDGSWLPTSNPWSYWGSAPNSISYTGNSKDGAIEHYGPLEKDFEMSAGAMTGSYVNAGTWTFTYTVTDLAGQTATDTGTFIVASNMDYSIQTAAIEWEGDFRFVTSLGADVNHGHLKLVERGNSVNVYEEMFYRPSNLPTTTQNFIHTVEAYRLDPSVGIFDYEVFGVDSGHTQVTTTETGSIQISPAADTTPPVITLQGKYLYNDPHMVDMGLEWSEPGATAVDDVDGTVPVTTDTSALDMDTIGTYYVTYTASDQAGNTATVQRVVVVCDNASPILTLNGSTPVTITEGDTYVDAGATATDGGGDISDAIVTTGSVDANTPGTYTITYNVSDPSGNAADPVSRTVIVEEYVNVTPTITLTGDSTIMVEVYGGTYTEPGYTAADVEDGDLTEDVNVTYELDGASVNGIEDGVAGTYTITYSVTDSGGETGTATRTVMVGEHNCPVVVDLDITDNTPNLSGISVVANGNLNYNGTTVDVSGYTSGQWASLAENVGLGATYVTESSLNVQQISGVALTNVAYWQALPISQNEVFNVTSFVGERVFAEGIALSDTQSGPVEETLIKFFAYFNERTTEPLIALQAFEVLSDPVNVYPFSWHCALDSKFAAQDVAILASDTYGSNDLSEELLYPRDFIEFRLNEMLTRDAIDPHTWHKKSFGVDGAGLVKKDGSKYKLHELQTESPERHGLVEKDIKTSKSAAQPSVVVESQAAPKQTFTDAAHLIYDQVHNKVDLSDPTTRQPRKAIVINRLSTDVSRVSSLSSATLARSLARHTGDEHYNPEFLGGLYSAETSKSRPSQKVLNEINKLATDNSVDISSYTG